MGLTDPKQFGAGGKAGTGAPQRRGPQGLLGQLTSGLGIDPNLATAGQVLLSGLQPLATPLGLLSMLPGAPKPLAAPNPMKQADNTLPYQANMDEQMGLLRNLIGEIAASRAPQQDLTMASEAARQAASRRGLTGGMAAGLETSAMGDVNRAFSQQRMGNLQNMLGLSFNTALNAQGAEGNRRMYMMQLAQSAAQGDAEANQALWELIGGGAGAVGGGLLGTFAMPGLGTAAGASLGYGLGRGAGGAAYGAYGAQPQTLGQYY